MVQKNFITKTQARYLSRKDTQKKSNGNLAEIIPSSPSVAEEVVSVAPLLEEAVVVAPGNVLPTIETISVAEANPVPEIPIQIKKEEAKKKEPERKRMLIEGEAVSFFVESLRRERFELIDAVCAAGFNHNRFALGNDGYAEEVRHEVHNALTLSEWSVATQLERKEYGYRSWKDIAEEVAQVTIVQKDVLTDTLFDAIMRDVRLYPSAGTKDMMRRGLIDTLVLHAVPPAATDGLKDFLSEVLHVYYRRNGNAPYSPFEYALITAVYAYYGDTPPHTVSHEIVHSGGWSGLKKTLLKGGSTSTVDQYVHSPKSEKYQLPDIATLTHTI
jgi:hypothetical protein